MEYNDADMEARRPRAVEFIHQFFDVGIVVQFGLMAISNPILFKQLDEAVTEKGET